MKSINYSPKFLYKPVLLLLLLVSTYAVNAQLTVVATSNVGGATNCSPRVINTTVSGGSGTYQYIYGFAPGFSGTITSASTPTYTISPAPTAPTTYRVIVIDLVTSAIAFTDVAVGPQLVGEPNVFIPNVFTPNGDGINDLWTVTDAAKNQQNPAVPHPINGYKYELVIVTSGGGTVYTSIQSADVATDGISSIFGIDTRQISWAGTIRDSNNNLVMVPNGTYFYSLIIYNCSYPSGKTYTGYITKLT
jgi:hypothetical protein